MAHAIQIKANPEMADAALERLKTDLRDGPFTEALTEQHTLPTVRSDMSTEHAYGMARFNDAEPRDRILQLLTDGVLRDADWYVVETHDCTHDRDGGACDGWIEADREGDVPL